MISIKLAFRLKEEDETEMFNWNSIQEWKRGKPKRRMNAFKVRCFIFQCRDLAVGDEEGTSDPFLSVWNSDG